MEMNMFDGEKDGESHRESMKKLDEKVRKEIGMMSPVVSAIKTEEDSDDMTDHQDKKEADDKRHARDVLELQNKLVDLQLQAKATREKQRRYKPEQLGENVDRKKHSFRQKAPRRK